MTEPGKIKWAFLIACAMETLSASWLLISGIPPVIVSILHVLSGLIIAALFLFIPLAQSSAPAMLRDGHMQVAMKWMMLIVTAIIFFVASKSIFAENPVDYRNADMIPVIRTMNERVLHGNLGQVYSGIPEIWNGSQPIYLPFMWLPFLPAVFMHIDPRWTTVVALFFSFALLIRPSRLRSKGIQALAILALAVLFLWWLFAQDDYHGFISLTEEGVVLFAYALLATVLAEGRPMWVFTMLAVCMLCRYSGIGFIPAFLLYLILARRGKEAIWLAITGLVFFLVFLLIPFGWVTLEKLMHQPQNYIGFSAMVWRDSPAVYTSGLGLARFFIPGHMEALHLLLVTLSFLIPIAFVIASYCFRRLIRYDLVPLAALKLSVVVFYNLVTVPYQYLFYTSVWVSLLMAIHMGEGRLGISRSWSWQKTR